VLPLVLDVGLLLLELGRLEEAEELLREAYTTRRRMLGSEHPSTLAAMDSLAVLLQRAAKYGDAEVLFREAIATRQAARSRVGGAIETGGARSKTQGARDARDARDDAPRPDALTAETLTSMNNLGAMLMKQGKYEEAMQLLRTALDERKRLLGSRHSDTLVSLSNLAALFLHMKDDVQAEPYIMEAVRTSQEILGGEHPYTRKYANNLCALWARKRGLWVVNKWQSAIKGNERFREMAMENMRQRREAEGE
jgi:tetratricopeptide (TPR) repeat protein